MRDLPFRRFLLIVFYVAHFACSSGPSWTIATSGSDSNLRGVSVADGGHWERLKAEGLQALPQEGACRRGQ